MKNAKIVYIVGIGGIGTSAAARYFVSQGAAVFGSDVKESAVIEGLRHEGIEIFLEQKAENLPKGCDVVIYSPAIPEANEERVAAKERGILTMSYPEFLGELAKGYRTIAVSGTNGKSTTTAMTAKILIDAGLDPTVIVGTMVPGWEGKNFRKGAGEWFVVEACEYREHMLHIAPEVAVITNIEEDHLDYYRDIDHIREAFQKWADGAKTVVLNGHDDVSKKIEAKGAVYFSAREAEEVNVGVPGAFNRANAAAAMAAAKLAGVGADVAGQSLTMFKGTWRRFEHVGTWNGAEVYSDYAHHPSATLGAIQAFKEFYPDRKLVVCFEPHQYNRTAELFDEFTVAFEGADALVLSEVYEVAGRNEFAGKTSKDLADAIVRHGNPKDVVYAENLARAEEVLRSIVQPGDVVVCMGAGDVDVVARRLVRG